MPIYYWDEWLFVEFKLRSHHFGILINHPGQLCLAIHLWVCKMSTEHLRGVFITRRYTNPRSPLPLTASLNQTRTMIMHFALCDLLIFWWIGDRAFSVAAPRAWNRLPTELKLLQSTDSFCRDLWTFLFHSVYGHQDTDWLCDAPSVFQ